MRKPEGKKESLMHRLENSEPGKAIYHIGIAAGAAAALGGMAFLAYKLDEIESELASILGGTDEPDVGEPIEIPPMEEQTLDPALATETVPTTVETTPTVEVVVIPAAPSLPKGWELAPEVFSTGSAPQQEAAVKERGACAAHTFECKDGVFPGGDHFAYVTGCPKPSVDWTGWEPGKTVDVKMEDKKFYEKGMPAPADLCAQMPDVNGRVIHYFK